MKTTLVYYNVLLRIFREISVRLVGLNSILFFLYHDNSNKKNTSITDDQSVLNNNKIKRK